MLPIRGERWQLGQIPERRATVAMASVFPARLQRLCALPSFRGVPPGSGGLPLEAGVARGRGRAPQMLGPRSGSLNALSSRGSAGALPRRPSCRHALVCSSGTFQPSIPFSWLLARAFCALPIRVVKWASWPVLQHRSPVSPFAEALPGPLLCHPPLFTFRSWRRWGHLCLPAQRA